MSMKQIETLVFDYGGVIVNIDDASVVKAMESLGVTAFKRLIHVRKIKRLMHQYINGLVAEAETLQEMLILCRMEPQPGILRKSWKSCVAICPWKDWRHWSSFGSGTRSICSATSTTHFGRNQLVI